MKSRADTLPCLDALPGEWIAPPQWRAIDLISDLHLAEDTPDTRAALAHYLSHTSADAIFLLGDIFEVWIGDDARHQPFEAGLLAMFAQAAARTPLFFMAGNRDFLLGAAMARDAGLTRLADPCLLQAFGQRYLLSHGDAWCQEDHDYQAFRAQVRSPAWQQAFLDKPLQERRGIARGLRERSMAQKAGQADHPELWADLDADCVRAALRSQACRTLIHGHTHRPARHALGEGLSREVLSDWDLEASSPRAEVLRLEPAGLRRLPLAAATA
ncbi:UDP-2,3-diacylglucosamine diphosphatase [Mitsuaria sp. WAJ17]|uniref:UDP-2,3-diacylglucosamine diphosphatase n=1 Tax=Mitsuaria sp. WAJ17 TaxID=2761452 RepID=UPI002107D113|nr:UDP-2,3-diacylglucosamine diphosphatase [Mitsuaria sp. WAJ17]